MTLDNNITLSNISINDDITNDESNDYDTENSNNDINNSSKRLNENLEDNAPAIIKNLIESNQLIKSNKKSEFRFNKPIQNFCLTNVTDDIKSLRYFIELINTPRSKIKDVELLRIKNENKNNSNFIIPSGFQLINTLPHRAKKIKLVFNIQSEDINSIVFVTIDDSYLVKNFKSIYRNMIRIFIPGKNLLKELNGFSKNINIKGKNISGTQLWIYVESLKLVIVSSINIEIKVIL
ncbi:hypothetical protein PIROE2DRAFT_2432 [Piromyces sp. E2]|nr:hypothetical protein PIROE2DRAFT_2432 [Piromyces sp. E2]|eukprot:OUM69570.1 hypothetical protein PIROE2DRAFT_2432 [Piromyces sp. E2]